MEKIEKVIQLGGRVFLAFIFIMSGIHKLTDISATTDYIASKGLPLAMAGAVGAGILELVAAFLIVVGFKVRLGALSLVVFLIPTTLIFHNPMGLAESEAQMQMIQIMKNLSIMGGLLYLAAYPPKAWGLDCGNKKDSM